MAALTARTSRLKAKWTTMPLELLPPPSSSLPASRRRRRRRLSVMCAAVAFKLVTWAVDVTAVATARSVFLKAVCANAVNAEARCGDASVRASSQCTTAKGATVGLRRGRLRGLGRGRLRGQLRGARRRWRTGATAEGWAPWRVLASAVGSAMEPGSTIEQASAVGLAVEPGATTEQVKAVGSVMERGATT